MRNWTKYNLDYSTDKVVKLSQDSSFPEHANAMGYDEGGLEYEDTDNFSQKYFYNYHSGRLLRKPGYPTKKLHNKNVSVPSKKIK